MKNQFYFLIGIALCIIFFYNKVLQSRLPRDLEDLLSYDPVYLFFGVVSVLISIVVVFSLFYFRYLRKNKEKERSQGSFLWELYKNLRDHILFFIIKMNAWIKLPFKAVYYKTVLNKDLPNIGTFYITLGNIVKILVDFFGEEVVVFVFIFLPRLLISIFFFLDVVFYHYIENFYYSLPLVFINLLFQVLFLQGLDEYLLDHIEDTFNYLDIEEKDDGYFFEVRKEWLNTDIEEDKDIIATHFIFCCNCYRIVCNLRGKKQEWNPWMTLLTQGFYLLKPIHILLERILDINLRSFISLDAFDFLSFRGLAPLLLPFSFSSFCLSLDREKA